MEINVKFTNIDSSDAVKGKIEEKTARLEKYFAGDFKIQWNCSKEHDSHTSSVTLHGSHMDFNAHDSAESLYKTIDGALDKLEKQLARHKDKTKDKHRDPIEFNS